MGLAQHTLGAARRLLLLSCEINDNDVFRDWQKECLASRSMFLTMFSGGTVWSLPLTAYVASPIL